MEVHTNHLLQIKGSPLNSGIGRNWDGMVDAGTGQGGSQPHSVFLWPWVWGSRTPRKGVLSEYSIAAFPLSFKRRQVISQRHGPWVGEVTWTAGAAGSSSEDVSSLDSSLLLSTAPVACFSSETQARRCHSCCLL